MSLWNKEHLLFHGGCCWLLLAGPDACHGRYIICPDNDVTWETDRKRIQWAAEDITHNRPPLSRWYEDYKDAFAAFMKAKEASSD
jgi:hypothetical protein